MKCDGNHPDPPCADPECYRKVHLGPGIVNFMRPGDCITFDITRHQVILNALRWLDENEPKWELDEPIDRQAFIAGLLRT